MLNVENLSIAFESSQGKLQAVDDISFCVNNQEILGLVGESGSGKSVTALSILNLLSKDAILSAKTLSFRDKNILDPTQIKKIRGRDIGLIFQNPLAALNPVYTIGNQLIETIQLHQGLQHQDAKKTAIDLLEKVKIPDPEKRLESYPHHFSLGMCQRVMIAITLAMKPSLLIADEITASLDVTIQAQILALLNELKTEFKMSILMISHDLGVIAQHCDRIMVMYLGKIVEEGRPHDIFKNPQHPYTQALIASIPSADPDQSYQPTLIKGDIPSPLNIPKGCRFHPRCPKVKTICKEKEPLFKDNAERRVACWLFEDET